MSEIAGALSRESWHGPGARVSRLPFSWHRLLWSLVLPARRHQIGVTIPGVFLIGLAMGIGTAAYNTASNILFITLSLLLACLLLSGLLSWFNLRGVCWRLRSPGPWRAGHETMVTIEVQNRKSWLPTYGLWFDLRTHLRLRAITKPEKDVKVREALAEAERAVVRGRVFLRERLGALGDATIDWVHRPEKRGEAVLELESVGSFFPFGFLRKSVGAGVKTQVLVWPAQIDYQWRTTPLTKGAAQGQRTTRAGTGDDLLAMRKYAQGDSHRLIHWKASARLGQLMVRQFAAESVDGYALRLETPDDVWTRPEQFELLCSFAATLAEDLFAAGRLRGVTVNDDAVETRRVHDLEAFLNLIARLEPLVGATAAATSRRPDISDRNQGRAARNLITFAPEGARGVTAYVDGVPTASA